MHCNRAILRIALAASALWATLTMSACDFLSSDLGNQDGGTGIFVDLEDTQPTSPDNGVLVRVSSRGGSSLRVLIEHGTFVPAAVCAVSGDGGPCECFDATRQVALSVRSEHEALLTLSLHEGAHCDGAQTSSLQVPIRPVTTPPEAVDAAVDGAEEAIDGPAPDGQVIDAP